MEIKEENESVEVITKTNKRYVFPKSDVTFLPLPTTTSELLAKYIHEEIKKIYPDIPIVLLTFDEADLKEFQDFSNTETVDRVFLWSGDARILLSIIKTG